MNKELKSGIQTKQDSLLINIPVSKAGDFCLLQIRKEYGADIT